MIMLLWKHLTWSLFKFFVKIKNGNFTATLKRQAGMFYAAKFNNSTKLNNSTKFKKD